MKHVKLTESHDRLAITAQFGIYKIRYGSNRGSDTFKVESPAGSQPITQKTMRTIFNFCNKFAHSKETNGERVHRVAKVFEKHTTLDSLLTAIEA